MSLVKSVTRDTFQSEVLESELPVIVDFYASWCPPCKMLAPMLDQMAVEFDGRIKFVKVDSDEESSLAESFNVTGLPTIVFIENGEHAGQFAGLPQEDMFRNELIDWLNSQAQQKSSNNP